VAKALGNTYGAQFIVSVLAGVLTFGGAYTAIPFMQVEAVTGGAWVSSKLFLDAIAVAQVRASSVVICMPSAGPLCGSQSTGSPSLWPNAPRLHPCRSCRRPW